MPLNLAINGRRVTAASGITNWSTFRFSGANGASAVELADGFIQGGSAVGFTYSVANRGFIGCFDLVAAGGSALNFSAIGNEYNKYIYVWVNPLFGLQSTGNSLGGFYGGIGIAVSDNATLSNSWAIWSLYGFENYGGGWQKIFIDPTKRPTLSGGTFSSSSLTGIRQVGIAYNFTAGRSGPQAVWVDAIDVIGSVTAYGSGTTNDSWRDILRVDEETSGNRYGIIKSLDAGKNVLELQTTMYIGDSSSGLYTKFSDIDRTIVFKEPYYITSSGTFALAVPENYAGIEIQGNATSGTDFSCGVLVQATDPDDNNGRNGMTIIGSAGDYYTDFHFSNNNSISKNRTKTKLYGCNFRNIRRNESIGIGLDPNIIRWYSSGGEECYGTSFDNCYQMVFDSGVIFRNNTFLNSNSGANGGNPQSALLLGTESSFSEFTDDQIIISNIKNCRFIANDFAIQVNSNFSGSYTLDSCTFINNTYDFRYDGIYTGTINLTNGSDPTTQYSPVGQLNLLSAVTLTLTNIQDGSEVRIRPSGNKSVILFAEENVIGGESTYTYNYPPTYTGIDIFVMKTSGYKWFSLPNYQLGASSTDLYISQIPDRTYTNP